jgi:hypothetical protein
MLGLPATHFLPEDRDFTPVESRLLAQAMEPQPFPFGKKDFNPSNLESRSSDLQTLDLAVAKKRKKK